MLSNSIDSLMPREMAFKAENAGVIKANLDFGSTFMLALLAGAFIGFGAVFSTTVIAGNGLDGAIKLPFGLMRLIGGSVFCLGLILVTVAGAEMFTGNVLLVMAAASRKITVSNVLRNWSIVFLGNFVGATATAYLIFLTGHHDLMDGQVGRAALQIAEAKCQLDFTQALMRAVFCNILVCLALWLSFSGRTLIDKVVVIVFPISAFVTSGFEHSVANMYFMSIALFIKSGAGPEFWTGIAATPEHFGHVTWGQFLLGNLLPVTIGNTIGGLMVGLMYWSIYCRPNIMLRTEDKDLLKRLTSGGRRTSGRADCNGMVTLHGDGREFHGKLKNLGEGGLMMEFYAATGLPVVSDVVSLDVDVGDGGLKLHGLTGKIVNGVGGKNLMGREFTTYSVRFLQTSEDTRRAIRAFVGEDYPSPAKAGGRIPLRRRA